MQVASVVLQLHLCPTVATALHPTWQPCSLLPRHHHVPIFCLSYTGLNWDSSICNKWNNMFKALSIDHHKCRISLDFKGLLFVLRSEACPGHHHPGPALSLKGMPLIIVVGQCYQLVQDHQSPQTHPRRNPIVLQVPLLPHLSRAGEVVAILTFLLLGPEECWNQSAPMDESTTPEVHSNWVLPLTPYEELSHHLQFLPTIFELVEPLHTS